MRETRSDEDPRDWFERRMESSWNAELLEQIGAVTPHPHHRVRCVTCIRFFEVRTPSEPQGFECIRCTLVNQGGEMLHAGRRGA
jgi:hypothetical protein